MAKLNTKRNVTHTLELTEEEAQGLFRLLNYGVHYASAHSLKLATIVEAMSGEFEDTCRSGGFASVATLK